MAETPSLIQFGINSYRPAASTISAERCLNMYAEKHNARTKSPVVVRGAPGIVTLATCGNGPVRGVHEFQDLLYVVSGPFLYSVSQGGTVTQLGGRIEGVDLVSIDDNGEEIAIVGGKLGYLYDETVGFRQITDIDFHRTNSVSNIDGFFAFDRDETNEFFISDSLDGASYSDYFASAETRSDNLFGVLNHLQTLHVFGKRTIELWVNVGAANFPFRRMPGGVVDRGIIGPRAYAQEDNTVYVMGDDKIGYRLLGPKLEKITTTPIDERWQAYTNAADVEMFGYTFEGHKFIVYNFISANETWVYDISTGLWHERESRDENNTILGRWRVSCSGQAYGKTIFGDAFSGMVGYADRATFTEFGAQIVGEVVAPPIYAGGKYVNMPWLELNLETGVGNSGQGEDPQILLMVDDGDGYTGPEMWASLGKTGERLTQVRFGPLGGFYERTMRVVFADPVRRTLISSYAPDMEIGV
jgi:hypothetical protein